MPGKSKRARDLRRVSRTSPPLRQSEESDTDYGGPPPCTDTINTPSRSLVDSMRSRLEKQLVMSTPMAASSKLATPAETEPDPKDTNIEEINHNKIASFEVSPNLARLRSTAGRRLREKQAELLKKHREARNNTEVLSVGGGVSIWPEMENMRLTSSEVATLVVLNVLTLIGIGGLFNFIHGHTLVNLDGFTKKLQSFHLQFPLQMSDNSSFRKSVLNWHSAFTKVMDDIDDRLNVTLPSLPWHYKLYTLTYISGIGLLLYFLADNIFAKSKLTPKRIKSWVTLLVILGTWTLKMYSALFQAQRLELTVETNVHKFSQYLGELVYLDLDLTTYHNVLLHWKTRCLPPTTQGTLTLLGLIPVRDIAYYMQYYSLPLLTAFLTPVVKLVIALKEVYSVKVH